MTYTKPTAADLKARFPKYASVDDAVVTTAIDEADAYVSQSWVTEADFKLGYMLYAAHVMTLDGHGTGAEAEMAAGGLLGFDSITSGKLSVKRAAGAGGSTSAGVLGQTDHGRRFLEMRRRNVAGPIAAVSATSDSFVAATYETDLSGDE